MKKHSIIVVSALLALCQGGWADAEPATVGVRGMMSAAITAASLPAQLQGDGKAISAHVESAVLDRLAAREQPDVIVKFGGKADLSPANTLRSKQARGHFTYSALTNHADQAQAGARQALASFGRHPAGLNDERGYQVLWLTNSIAIKGITQSELDALRRDPNVVGIRRQIVLPPLEIEGTPADNVRGGGGADEPHIVQMHVPEVWAMGHRGEGIVVGSTDGGVRHTHQALVNQYRGNQGGGNFDHNYNWFDPYQNSAVPRSSSAHGQHTMGTSVGDDGGTNRIGVAPDARWIACIGFGGDGGGATDAGLIACGQFALAPTDTDGNNPDPARAAHVVNNSWGSTVCNGFYDNWYEEVVDAWIAAGIVPVFSIGNASNCSLPNSPPPGLNGASGQYGKSFSVGSSGLNDGLYAPHSIKGPTTNPSAGTPDLPSHFGYPNLKPNIVAPGVNIRSAGTTSDTDYFATTGTSMSAPAVTGLVALMWGAADCLVGDYATTGTLIMSTARAIPVATGSNADGIGNIPNQATGWGEIDALAAVNASIAHCADPAIDSPLIRVTRVVNLEVETGAAGSQPLLIENTGIGSLNWSIGEAPADCAAPDSVDWLGVDAASGTADVGDSSNVSITANAAGQAVGDYSARLCVTSNDGDGNALVDVLVRLTVRPEGFEAPFPAPYCTVNAAATPVLPISRVVFADIDNTSAAASGAPALENFLDQVADVQAGETIPITVKMNTSGNNRFSAAVYVDWNGDGFLNTTDEEFTSIGFLTNSSGTDNQEISVDVAIPPDVEPGEYRMRVLSRFAGSAGSLPINSCGSVNGQGEDYTVRVVGEQPAADLGLTLAAAPNPVDDGGTVTLTAEVGNAGPEVASDVEVRFTLPAQLVFDSANPAGWSCSDNAGVVTCVLADDLASGADAPALNVLLLAESATDVTVDVDARVSGAVDDPAAANDIASLTVGIVGAAQDDAIFCDGFEQGGDGSCGGGSKPNPDIVVVDDVNFAPPVDSTGGSINWLTGETCECDSGDFNFNMWLSDGVLAFFFPVRVEGEAGALVGGDGVTVQVLAPGASIGPDGSYSTETTGTHDEMAANWRQAGNVDGYLGFRFLNTETGEVNFGYARLTTTGTSGFPATIVSYAYNRAGDPITIP